MSTDFIIDVVTALWLGFLGACIGSFLNVVAYRLPLGMSVVWKPSHCPKCNHPIRARDNVPVLGWLWLRGKCRDCGAPISPRYAIVEAIMGVIFFALAFLELFRGGANLWGGPMTDLRGAMDIVWNPQWPAISQYAFHGLLVSVLMVFVLLRLDGNISVKKFLGWTALTVILYPLPAIFYSQIGA
ncbi:MAG: prepilin peptidase [Bythopirellula sp.]|nr:prepilin peptidase [Bythopirellula sp.]